MSKPDKQESIQTIAEYIIVQDSEWDFLQDYLEDNPDSNGEENILYHCHVALNDLASFESEVAEMKQALGLTS